MYVCGITPYDATHLGHAATYIAFDLLQRVWRDAGHDVHYVQNVTDVDDPLLERAAATGEDWTALAERETALFREDMTALRVLPPDHYVGAVESIPLIVAADRASCWPTGAAYHARTATSTSRSHADPHFGEVSGLEPRADARAVFAERGGDPDRPGKKHPLDPLLWLAARPGEPAWDTELGHGRPGWHIECVAIALEYLGMAFDVQGGGSDLAFPHHEMGASHAQVLTGGDPFARAYVHAGMVALDGEKMSKSRGNLVFVSKLRRDGRATRPRSGSRCSRHHYRSDWEWTDADLLAGPAAAGPLALGGLPSGRPRRGRDSGRGPRRARRRPRRPARAGRRRRLGRQGGGRGRGRHRRPREWSPARWTRCWEWRSKAALPGTASRWGCRRRRPSRGPGRCVPSRPRRVRASAGPPSPPSSAGTAPP